MKKIGFTTTVPVELVLAAGHVPVDLNNIFVTSADPTALIDSAHAAGLPRNCCSWIKGLYTIGAELKAVDEIIAVTNGDCSNTHALTELFSEAGIPVRTFSYPYGEKNPYGYLKLQMEDLSSSLGTSLEKVREVLKVTTPIREKLKILDSFTCEGKVSGFENHLWLVSSSDFNGDPAAFSEALDDFLKTAAARDPSREFIRLGYVGVPPIIPAIYDFIEEKSCRVIFNEVQRQFSIPSESPDYVQKYIDYTYPYGIAARIKDIRSEIEKRKLDGVIHYVQSFCYRQLQDSILKKHMPVPVLTVESDAPGELDGRTKIRIESFIEMLKCKRQS